MREAVATYPEEVSAALEAIRSLLPERFASPDETVVLVGGLVVVLALALASRRLRGRVRARRQAGRSRRRHERARDRDPPVGIGDVITAGVQEFSRHHSGERHAVCKVEGFVVFVQGLPDDLAAGDVVRAKILSYNRGRTSATARFLERA